MKAFLAILLLLTMAGCATTEDYGAIAGFANVVAWVVGILISAWIWRKRWLRRAIARNFEREFKRDDELAFLHSRIDALQALTLAIAKASPQADEIKSQFSAVAEERRSVFQSMPMSTERAEALMQPFNDCLSDWKS